jgi:hypothetical protein
MNSITLLLRCCCLGVVDVSVTSPSRSGPAQPHAQWQRNARPHCWQVGLHNYMRRGREMLLSPPLSLRGRSHQMPEAIASKTSQLIINSATLPPQGRGLDALCILFSLSLNPPPPAPSRSGAPPIMMPSSHRHSLSLSRPLSRRTADRQWSSMPKGPFTRPIRLGESEFRAKTHRIRPVRVGLTRTPPNGRRTPLDPALPPRHRPRRLHAAARPDPRAAWNGRPRARSRATGTRSHTRSAGRDPNPQPNPQPRSPQGVHGGPQGDPQPRSPCGPAAGVAARSGLVPRGPFLGPGLSRIAVIGPGTPPFPPPGHLAPAKGADPPPPPQLGNDSELRMGTMVPDDGPDPAAQGTAAADRRAPPPPDPLARRAPGPCSPWR